jgi:hypothetical protein
MKEFSLIEGVTLYPARVKEGLGHGAKAQMEVDTKAVLMASTAGKVTATFWRPELERLREWLDEALA